MFTAERQDLEEVLIWDWHTDSMTKYLRPDTLESVRKDLEKVSSKLSKFEQNASDLQKTIAPIIEAAHKKSWLRENWKWFLTTIIAALALMVPIYRSHSDSDLKSAIDGRLEEKFGSRMTTIERDMIEVKTKLGALVAASSIKTASELPVAQLAKHLPEIRKSIEVARAEGVTALAPDILKIQSKLLLVNTASPEYWPLVFELISYRSLIITGLDPRSEPPVIIFKNNIADPPTTIEGGAYQLEGLVSGVTFNESWIEFKINGSITLKNVHFNHCVLVFRGLDIQSPSPEFRQLGKQLLASDIANATVSSSGSGS